MSDLNFGDGSWEEAAGVVTNTLQELVTIVKGNGKDGVQTILSNFITEYRTDRDADKRFHDRRDNENSDRESRRWRIAGFLLAVIMAVLAFLGYLETNRQLHGKFSRTQPDSVLSSTQPQDAQTYHGSIR